MPAEHADSNQGEASDQTSRKSQQIAKGPHANLLALLELIDWFYFRLDSSGRLIEASHHLAHLLSTTPGALLGTPFASLFIPSHASLLSELLFLKETPRRRQFRPDKLQLSLFLRSPFVPDTLEDLSSHTQANTASANEPTSIPVEVIIAVGSDEETRPAPDSGLSIEGLLHPTQKETRPPTGYGREEPLVPQDEQENVQQRLHAIKDIGQRVASSEDLETLLQYLVAALQRDLGYQYAEVFQLDGDRKSATLRASSESAQAWAADPGPGANVELRVNVEDQGVLGTVLRSGEAILVNDLTHHPQDKLLHHHADVRSVLAVPLTANEGVAGVLLAYSDAPDAFELDDVLLFQILADQAATAIANTALLSERDQRLAEWSALNQIGMLLASPGRLVDTLDAIIRQVNALFQVEAASLMLVEDQQLHFRVAAGTQIDQIKPFTLEIGQGIAGWAVQHNQTVRVNDVAADTRHYPGIDQTISFDTRSLIAAPLRIAKRSGDIGQGNGEERVIGVIEIINRLDGRSFTRNDEILIEFIASSAAVVIENVRLFNELEQRYAEMAALQQETQRRVDALTALGQASETINRAQGSEEILSAAIEAAAALMPSNQGVALLLREAQTTELHAVTHQGFKEGDLDALSTLEIEESGDQGVRLIPDLLVSSPLAQASQQAGAMIAVPLRGMEEIIGYIVLRESLPSYETRRLLQTLGDMVAIAIEKARLHDQTTRRLAEVSTLYTLANQITTTLDLDRILETTVTIIHHALDCQRCCLYLQDPRTGDLALKASSGWSPVEQEAADLAFIGQISRQVLRKRQPVNLTDVRSPKNLSKIPTMAAQRVSSSSAEEGSTSKLNTTSFRSLLIVPLVTQNTLIGTLSIDDRAADAFGAGEGRLLTITAAQVSVAIENARLLRNLRNRAIQLEQAIEELRELHRAKTEFMQNVSHELRTPLTFVKSYVQLVLDEAMGEINPDLRKTLTIVDQRTDAIIRLVNDVISLEQVEMGKSEFRPVSLAEIAAQSVEGASMTAKESGIKIELEVEDGLPLVHADPGRLGQVFDNLLGNGIKFSPSGSHITVRVWRDGTFVRADVADQGIGIPADKLDRIFDRFYQVDGSTTRRFSGTGLGLAIVKSIVGSHGGQVTVESEVGAGSTFSFALPIPSTADSE